jgi:hypothetical protein
MAQGLPDQPPPDLLEQFVESQDDETCPVCGWDTEEARTDPQAAFNSGILIAVEQSASPFTAQSATSIVAEYWRCPNPTEYGPTPNQSGRCGTLFTTENDVTFGAMA